LCSISRVRIPSQTTEELIETHDGFLDSVRSQIEPYDRTDLAECIGALELVPANSSQNLRTGIVARALFELDAVAGRPLISQGRLRKLFSVPPVGDVFVRAMEDPLNDLFVEEIVLPVGSFLAMSGGTSEAVARLGQLAHATAVVRRERDDVPLRDGLRTSIAVLALSDATLRRAGLSRGTMPGGVHRGEVTIPDAHAMASLKAAVRFGREELGALLDRYRLGLEDLEPLVVGGQGRRFRESALGPIPAAILRNETSYVVASPSSLVTAAMHTLVAGASRSGCLERFASVLAEHAGHSVAWSLRLLGIRPIRGGINLNPPHNVSHQVLQFDRDKLLNVIVVADDFRDFDSDLMESEWRSDEMDRALERIVSETENRVFTDSGEVNAIQHLIVLQPASRPGGVSVSHDASPSGAPLLMLTVDALRVVALLESGDPIALWYWALHKQRLIATDTRVMSWNALDDFSVYRRRWHSYYLSDERRPDAVSIDLDGVLACKAEVLKDFDIHGAVGPSGEWLELAKTNKEPGIAKYTPLEFSASPQILVKGDSFAVWIVANSMPADSDAAGFAYELVALVAYWLDRLRPELDRAGMGGSEPLCIEFELVEPEKWGHHTGGEGDVDCITLSVSGGRGRVALTHELTGLLGRTDNSGERQIVRQVLTLILLLASIEDAAEVAASIVDGGIPFGKDRAILVESLAQRPELDVGGLPPFRPVQESVKAFVLDRLGDHLLASGPRQGQVAADQRTAVINRAVELLFHDLMRLVATIRADELLPALLTRYERLIADRSRHELGLDRRLPDARTTAWSEGILKRALPELSSAALALRFLIEYVVAQEPNGLRPVSTSLLDELVALSEQIIHWGMDSDAIRFGLADSVVTMLGSGRLGISSPEWAGSMQSMLTVQVENRLARTEFVGLAGHSADDLAKFAIAAQDEFGFSFDRLAEVIGSVMSAGESASGYTICSRAALEKHLLAGGASSAEVNALFKHFALGPRDTFLQPPIGFTESDLWPWRFNRGLSYMRRPLLLWNKPEGQHVIWGNRHVMESLDNLVNLCLNGRLKARSPRMAEAMGRMANEDGKRFSEAVADIFSKSGHGFIVRRHVSKVGKEHLRRTNGQAIGDVDILAIHAGRFRIWAIEAKNLSTARTPQELRNEIDEILESSGGRTAAASHHLERVEWLQRHVKETLEWLALPTAHLQRWVVRPMIVTESDLMSRHVVTPVIPVGSYRQVANSLAKGPAALERLSSTSSGTFAAMELTDDQDC